MPKLAANVSTMFKEADFLARFALAARAGFRTETSAYPLERAQDALDDVRHGRLRGAAVLAVRPETP